MIGLRLLAGAALIMSNAFFVATEFSMTRLAKTKEQDQSLPRVAEMVQRLEIYLTGCQVGITFSSVLLGIVAEPALSELLGSIFPGGISPGFSVAISVLLINLAHTIWAEQAPTYLGIERAEMVARWFATPLYYWTKMVYPLIKVGDWAAKATLGLFGVRMERSWTEEGAEDASPRLDRAELVSKMGRLLEGDRDLPADRREEVLSALQIDQIAVDAIKTGLEDIVFLSTGDRFEKVLEAVSKDPYSRYPLREGTEGAFVGVLYTKELLANIAGLQDGRLTLSDIKRPALRVSQELTVSELIDRLQEESQELALVTREGGVTGLVTLTDALEEIVGESEEPVHLERAQKR